MQNERWRRLEELYHSTLALDREARADFMSRACGEDTDLRRKLESMLCANEESTGFLESSVFDPQALLDRLARIETPRAATFAGRTVAHYRVLEPIGAGGMGVVYKAEDTRLKRFVALKFLPVCADAAGSSGPGYRGRSEHRDQRLERFQREARAASALDHPNICVVYDIDECEGIPFIAMQYLVGRTLRDEIGRQPLPTDRIVDWGIQIADALDAAHGVGIVHRDIKPANLFITSKGQVKILDFGLAKLIADGPRAATMSVAACVQSHSEESSVEGPITLHGDVPGTVGYMSPEQACGKELDGRTDIFSCGVVLYEMATGTPPFQGGSPATVLLRGLSRCTPSPAAQLNPVIPDELQKVISKAMAWDPEARYCSAGELRDDLRRIARFRVPDSAVGGATRNRKRWWLAAILITLALPAIAAYLYAHRSSPPRLAERSSVVIADFVNTTGEPVFDHSLKQALRVELEQSPYLNVTPDAKTSQQLRYMGRDPESRLAAGVAREVCLRIGSQALLEGSISRLDRHYVIALDATSCHSGEQLENEQVEAESKDKVLEALGRAAARLRLKLGEPPASVRTFDAPMEEATTSSLEALQAYSLGVKKRFPDGERAAIPFFERAAELDPQFAMAFARLAVAYVNLDAPERATLAMEKAYQLRNRVSERERLYIESHYYDLVTEQYDKAIQTYQLWQRIYPDEVMSYSNLGALYNSLGQYEKSLEEQQQALRLDPTVSTNYSNLANAYLCLNQIDAAGRVLAQAQARNIEDPIFWQIRYLMAFLRGDASGLEREFNATMSRGEGEVLAFQADTEAYRGHLARAREFTRRAIALAQRHGDFESARGYRIVGALREADFGNLALARKEAVAALSPQTDERSRALSAVALARAGAATSALAIAHELTLRFPSSTLINNYWVPTIVAATEHDNPGKAIETLDAVTPYELGLSSTPTNAVPYPVYLRGLALLASGQGTKAAEEFQKILDHPGVVGNYPLGALAVLGRARAFALQGGFHWDPQGHSGSSSSPGERSRESLAKSAADYRDFLVLWKDADGDIPILEQARVEARRLQHSISFQPRVVSTPEPPVPD